MKTVRVIEMLNNSSYEAAVEIAVFALGIIMKSQRLAKEDLVQVSQVQGLLATRSKGRHHER